jgi:hypothetical protein
VERLVGPRLLLRGERRLVDEQISLSRGLEHLEGRPGVAREDELAPGPRRAEHLLGSHPVSVRKLDGLAALQPTEERALRNAERLRGLEVEATRPRVLDDAVTVRSDPVLDREGEDAVIAALQGVARGELAQLDVVGELSEDPAQHSEEVDEARRPVDGQRQLAAPKRKRLQHPGQAEVVVCVVVRQEDLVQLDEPDGRAKELPLSAFAAVEENPVASAAHQRPGQAAARRRHRA